MPDEVRRRRFPPPWTFEDHKDTCLRGGSPPTSGNIAELPELVRSTITIDLEVSYLIQI